MEPVWPTPMIAFSTNRTETSVEQQRFERLIELPPSAKLVFRVLQNEELLTSHEISERTLLPKRTTRYALNQLTEADLVKNRPNPHNVRQRLHSPQSVAKPSTQSE